MRRLCPSAGVAKGERLLPAQPCRVVTVPEGARSPRVAVAQQPLGAGETEPKHFFDAVDSDSQALSMFSAALASGQLGPLMSQFGLPAEAVDAANKGGKYWCCWEHDEVVCWGGFFLFVHCFFGGIFGTAHSY